MFHYIIHLQRNKDLWLQNWRLGGSLMSHHWRLGNYRARTYFSVPVFVNALFFCAVEMERGVLTKQRTIIKFLVKLSKSELRIFEYDLETNRPSEEWKHGGLHRSKKAHKSRSKIKICSLFIYIWGVIHYKFVPQGQTINATFHVEVLKCLHERVRHVQPELWA
jgi:hypothetical protein